MLYFARVPVEHHQARFVAFFSRILGYQFIRQFEFEL